MLVTMPMYLEESLVETPPVYIEKHVQKDLQLVQFVMWDLVVGRSSMWVVFLLMNDASTIAM